MIESTQQFLSLEIEELSSLKLPADIVLVTGQSLAVGRAPAISTTASVPQAYCFEGGPVGRNEAKVGSRPVALAEYGAETVASGFAAQLRQLAPRPLFVIGQAWTGQPYASVRKGGPSEVFEKSVAQARKARDLLPDIGNVTLLVLQGETDGAQGVGSVVAQGLVPKNRQASAIAIVFTGLTLANVLGVPFGTWLGQQTDWRMTFWAVAVIGVAAFAVMAWGLPRNSSASERSDWRQDLRVLARRPVLRGLAMTVLGYAGVFAVFTYIAPLLTEVAGFADSAVSPILLGFGLGLVVGNIVGGRLADRALALTVIASLVMLTAVLLTFGLLAEYPAGAAVSAFALGAAGFATVAPLQAWVMAQAGDVGQALAASVNIAAFNLGNAVGAAVGGLLLEAGAGYGALPYMAAIFPLAATRTGFRVGTARRLRTGLIGSPIRFSIGVGVVKSPAPFLRLRSIVREANLSPCTVTWGPSRQLMFRSVH